MTQLEWAHSHLQKHGYVSRNQALRKYITRLGAIVYELRRLGFNVQGEYVKRGKSLDYVYRLKK